MTEKLLIVVGGGIAGLTAGALLAREGNEVILLEAHSQTGGCAGTFIRDPYVFDVGATQVAGFERGGIHDRIFRHLNCSIPVAEVLDPACIVHLGDGEEPIHLWHDPLKWEEERKKHFPGSELFWKLCNQLHRSNWSFAGSDPILTIQNFWDFKQFLNSTRYMNLITGFFSMASIADLLWLCSCHHDQRLRKFLDCQLKLYSQGPSDQTAALYGATVLQMAQAPLGLFHLKGSMQKLSDQLLCCFLRDGGKLFLNHKVVGLSKNNDIWQIKINTSKKLSLNLQAKHVVFTLPPQSLLTLIPKTTCVLPRNYKNRLENLPQPSGAIVFFGAITRSHLPKDCEGHYQLLVKEIGSIFVSISFEGDGRAPLGQATVTASIFTDVNSWSSYSISEYRHHKDLIMGKILTALNLQFAVNSKQWLHKELATPRSFARWTGRPLGIVGGLGQKPTTFGPFGLSSRTPMKGLWLCGDSIYPGEGTACVSQYAVMACRQLMSEDGRELNLTK